MARATLEWSGKIYIIFMYSALDDCWMEIGKADGCAAFFLRTRVEEEEGVHHSSFFV